MQYKQNVHILLPIEIFEELKAVGKKSDLSRSELAREGIGMVLRKYRRKENRKDEGSNKNE